MSVKFGIREVCDVVLRAKSAQKVGNKIFYKNEPVLYFDTLKTTSLEGASSTVYAQGGKGNPRLIGWDGDRTLTFTMEDALISTEGLMILTGAGLVDSGEKTPIYQHITETLDASDVEVTESGMTIKISHEPACQINGKVANQNLAYVMLCRDDEVVSEPYIPELTKDSPAEEEKDENGKATGKWIISVKNHAMQESPTKAEVKAAGGDVEAAKELCGTYMLNGDFPQFDQVIVDYYVEKSGDFEAQQLEITADKFSGNYYLEASTLVRNQAGVDMPAEFIIPNCKIQSNFNFSMASSGDPSTFTFTMDAFPDYTRFDRSKKVLAAIQIISEAGSQDLHRHSTAHEEDHELLF